METRPKKDKAHIFQEKESNRNIKPINQETEACLPLYRVDQETLQDHMAFYKVNVALPLDQVAILHDLQ
ncbi:hypothetical protein L6452_08099 [Arctium lappa]|uniref:Uncharacterized protein n=1 Tax=Arctium lappa TaxID=4217 RepID=A0ACB9DGP6_ARCLA|nr:hypothetical protein L6452_08099 [Arctium lappa]